MSDEIVVTELAIFFSAILGDRVKIQQDENLHTNLKRCETLISSYDEFCEHGSACLGAEKQ